MGKEGRKRILEEVPSGITTTEGKHWKEQRQFLIDYLAKLTGALHTIVEMFEFMGEMIVN